MKYLVIDTCTSSLIISIIQNDKILAIHEEKLNSDMSTKIIPVMQELFNNLNMEPKDIDKIFVAVGPGSFTGIRIGVTVAKTFAWSLNIPIVPFSSLELMATTNIKEDYIVPIINARRDFVYAGIYDEHLTVIEKDKYISIEDLKNKLQDKNYSFVSYDTFENLTVTEPNINVLKIVEKYKNVEAVNPHKINPNYLKLTEAEMKLKNDNKNN